VEIGYIIEQKQALVLIMESYKRASLAHRLLINIVRTYELHVDTLEFRCQHHPSIFFKINLTVEFFCRFLNIDNLVNMYLLFTWIIIPVRDNVG